MPCLNGPCTTSLRMSACYISWMSTSQSSDSRLVLASVGGAQKGAEHSSGCTPHPDAQRVATKVASR
eukprot:1901829-Amphidinium_carterae.3